MWTLIKAGALALLPALFRLLFGGKTDTSRELGRHEQQNADMKADMSTVKAATEAAKKSEQEDAVNDPNNRDRV